MKARRPSRGQGRGGLLLLLLLTLALFLASVAAMVLLSHPAFLQARPGAGTQSMPTVKLSPVRLAEHPRSSAGGALESSRLSYSMQGSEVLLDSYPAPIFLPRSLLSAASSSLQDALSNRAPEWWFRAMERTAIVAQAAPIFNAEDAVSTCAPVDYVPSLVYPVCLAMLPLRVDDTCIAYSFHKQTSFEFELLLRQLGCEVYYFGPSLPPAVEKEGVILRNEDLHAARLDKITEELGHTRVDVLRVTCDSATCLSNLLPTASIAANVGVLYIDPSPADELEMDATMSALVRDAGFGLWFLHPRGSSTAASFINQNQALLQREAQLRAHRRRTQAGTILYLGSPGTSSSYGAKDHRGDKLTQSLTLLNTYYNARAENDVMILYTLDRPFSKEHKKMLAALHPPGKLSFRPLAGSWWSPPPFVDASKHKGWRRPAFSIGYRSMCRFFAVLIWDYMEALGYSYVWRLDDDSYILSRVEPVDVFAHMRLQGCNYGFRIGTYDNNDRDEFFVFVDQYIRENNLLVAHGNFSDQGRSRRTREIGPDYYTNFFIARVDFFRERRVRGFLDYIDRSGHIYYRRWGDLPIQSVTVHLFSHPTQICYLDSFTYEHISMQGGSCPSSGILQRGALVSDAEWKLLVDSKWVALNCEVCGGAEKGCYRDNKYFGPKWAVGNNLKRFDMADPGTVRGSLWPSLRGESGGGGGD